MICEVKMLVYVEMNELWIMNELFLHKQSMAVRKSVTSVN